MDSPDIQPPLITPENKISREKELNERTKIAAEFLSGLDQAVEAVKVDPDTGKISYEPQEHTFPNGEVAWYAQTYKRTVGEYQERHQTFIDDLRTNPQVIDTQIIAGAIVVTYDSSKGPVSIPLGDETHVSSASDIDGDRGSYKNANDHALGIALIDINKSMRTDNVSPTVTAVHELHHHALAVSDYLMSLDPKINMASAVRKIGNSALFGKGIKEPARTGMIAKETIKRDTQEYTALLGREYSDADKYNVEDQLRYLDELHSSYLQRKPNWFSAQHDVYTTRGKGKHWEVVGNNEGDQNATRDMLGYLQAAYLVDTAVMGNIKQQLENSPDKLPPHVKPMVEEWEQTYAKIGALIGTSRTVRQADALVIEAWNQFKNKHESFFEKNRSAFEQIIKPWEESGITASNVHDILLPKKGNEN